MDSFPLSMTDLAFWCSFLVDHCELSGWLKPICVAQWELSHSGWPSRWLYQRNSIERCGLLDQDRWHQCIYVGLTLLWYPISEPKLLSIHGGNNGSVNWALAQATSDTQVSWGDNVGELQEWVFQAILHWRHDRKAWRESECAREARLSQMVGN